MSVEEPTIAEEIIQEVACDVESLIGKVAQASCKKCKEMRSMKIETASKTKSHSINIIGKCLECATNVSTFLSKAGTNKHNPSLCQHEEAK